MYEDDDYGQGQSPGQGQGVQTPNSMESNEDGTWGAPEVSKDFLIGDRVKAYISQFYMAMCNNQVSEVRMLYHKVCYCHSNSFSHVFLYTYTFTVLIIYFFYCRNGQI